MSALHLIAVALLTQTPVVDVHPSARTIVVDGKFDDWRDVPVCTSDPRDAPEAAVDFGEVRITHDDRFVWLMIDFGSTINAQELDGTAMILFDADGDASTGVTEHGLDGVDFIVDLSPRVERNGSKMFRGMSVRLTGGMPADAAPPTVYDIDLQFGPTHAGRRMEFRLDRHTELPGVANSLRAQHFVCRIVFVDATGSAADETEIIRYSLEKRGSHDPKPDVAKDSAPQLTAAQLQRSADADVRAMSWNVHRSAFVRNADPFRRIVAAVQPDLIIVQEVHESTSADDLLRSFNLSESGKGEKWFAAIGTDGADLRCGIVARAPVTLLDSFEMLRMPGNAEQTIRAVAGTVTLNGWTLLVVSVHLRCCGRAGGEEDLQRIEESQVINAFVKRWLNQHAVDGVIIAGDFNLVGSREPLEIMAHGIDVDRSALAVVHPLQPDGLLAATWADRRQPFAPGRLDYMLFSDSRLELKKSLVLDTTDLPQQALEQCRVLPGDAGDASDHMPVIADFQFIRTRN